MNNRFASNKVWMVMMREWRQIFSRKLYIVSMVIMPLFFIGFFLTLMQDGLPKDLPAAVVDMDQSSISRRLVRQLDAFKQTKIVVHAKDFSEAREMMQRGEIYGIYYLPEGFEHDVLSFRQPKVSFYTSNSFIVAGSMLFRDMKTISILGSAAVERELRLAKGQTMEQAMIDLQPIVVETHPLGNPQLNYAVYLCNVLLPGLLSVMIVLLTVYALGVEVKEMRSRKLLDMVDDDILSVMVGKLLPYTLTFMLMATFYDVVLYRFMGFPCHNGLPNMLLNSLLLVLASQSLGVFLYSLVPIMSISLSLSAFITMLSFSISGFTFPVGEMPGLLQTWANVFPLRHYFLIYANNGLNGYSSYYVWGSYVAMLLYLFLPILVSIRLRNVYRYDTYKP